MELGGALVFVFILRTAASQVRALSTAHIYPDRDTRRCASGSGTISVWAGREVGVRADVTGLSTLQLGTHDGPDDGRRARRDVHIGLFYLKSVQNNPSRRYEWI